MNFNLLNGVVFFICVVSIYLFVRSAKKKSAMPSDTPANSEVEPEFNLDSVLEMAKQIYGRGYRYNEEIQKALNYPHLMSKEEYAGILKVADRICEYAGGLIGDKASDKNGDSYTTQCDNFRKVLNIRLNKTV